MTNTMKSSEDKMAKRKNRNTDGQLNQIHEKTSWIFLPRPKEIM